MPKDTIKNFLRALSYRVALGIATLIPRCRPRRTFRLVILKLDKLGDAVLAIGAMRTLTKKFGERDTLLVVSTIAEPLFRAEFTNVQIIALPPFCDRFWPDLLRFLCRHAPQLRAISAEKLVCLRHQASDYLHVIARLIGPIRSFASTCKKEHTGTTLTFPNLTRVDYPTRCEAGSSELEAHRRVVQCVFEEAIHLKEIIPSLDSIQPTVGEGLLVCPIAGAPIRQLSPDSLALTIQKFLDAEPDVRVTFCIPHSMSQSSWEEALSSMGIGSVRWWTPGSVMALAQAIGEARLVFAPESGPAHLTTALDKPGVFLLGGGHFGLLAPWCRSERQQWISYRMDCYHCGWNCIHREAVCITGVQEEHLSKALLQGYRSTQGFK